MTKRKHRRPERVSPSPPDGDTREAKRQRRLERQREEAAARHRAARRQRAKRVGLTVVAVVVVAAGAFFVIRPDPELPGVERPASRGRGHVTAPSYDTSTPTSGAHLAQAPACRSYAEPLDPGLAVHALEHGAVVIWYDIAIAEQLRPELETIAGRWDSHVVVSPNTALDAPIVATAWNRLARYDEAGDDVGDFIDTYRRRGPERQLCGP